MIKQTITSIFLLAALLNSSTVLSQTKKTFVWEQGTCHKVESGRDYECFIYVWGKHDDGNNALLQLVEKISSGVFSVNLSQTLVKEDLALNGKVLKSDYFFTVDERIPLKFDANNTIITESKDYPIVIVKIPVTENVFTYLENGKKIIKTTYEKSDGSKGTATFSMEKYIEQIAIMSIKVQQLKK
jgi:hypothetical protein